MAPARTAPGTTSTPEPEGVVSGAVLRLIRTQLGYSQERLAELLRVDPNTVKSWESGRRPLGRVSSEKLRALMRALSRLGAHPVLVDQLDAAIDVDMVLGDLLEHGHLPDDHPLGTWVHTRAWHDLLAWALAGTTPAALRQLNGAVPKPRLSPVTRDQVFANLRAAAEQADGKTSAEATLLRRQVYFVASWDPGGPARDWLDRQERRELRLLRAHDGWTPTWVAGRSLAVARAAQGDPGQLRHFITHQLADDRQEAANLNYWAYWIGEHNPPAVTDEFMTGDLAGWRGTSLLRHLTAGLHPGSGYVDLTVHTVWALLDRRPHLLDDDPALTADLRARVEALLQHPDRLSDQSRSELSQVHYATKMRGRPA